MSTSHSASTSGSAKPVPSCPRPADASCPDTLPRCGRRTTTRHGARGQGTVTARRRGRRCSQLGCHPSREATRAPSQEMPVRSPLSARSPGGAPRRAAPHPPFPGGVPPSPGSLPIPLPSPPPHNRPQCPAEPHPSPPPPGARDSPGPGRLLALTCHVPDPTVEGGASRPREGRGRHFRADKGRRHVRVGRNRPRWLPGCNFRRMRSARAGRGPQTGACASPSRSSVSQYLCTWNCPHCNPSLVFCSKHNSNSFSAFSAYCVPGTIRRFTCMISLNLLTNHRGSLFLLLKKKKRRPRKGERIACPLSRILQVVEQRCEPVVAPKLQIPIYVFLPSDPVIAPFSI